MSRYILSIICITNNIHIRSTNEYLIATFVLINVYTVNITFTTQRKQTLLLSNDQKENKEKTRLGTHVFPLLIYNCIPKRRKFTLSTTVYKVNECVHTYVSLPNSITYFIMCHGKTFFQSPTSPQTRNLFKGGFNC